jgi:AcrR family transcriptional regulator
MDDDTRGCVEPTAFPCPRGRNAAATKQAILEAARHCFAQGGYDQVGVREIAAKAGIDPALVNRYFGSKEGLFSAAVGSKFNLSDLFAGERSTLAERLVRYVLKKKIPEHEPDPLVALLRSSSSEVAAKKLRHAMMEGFILPLADVLEGPNARERAELVGCNLLGLLVYRTMVGGTAFDDVERQVALLAPSLQAMIDGTAPVPASAQEHEDASTREG